ncbi:MAG: SpoIIE family protein phosphatase [Armatimonadetes bacterium]|nr:SpoIIE family protein phosphatase [Armatimonadota bacterium]
MTIFLAGAPLALLIALNRADFGLSGRMLVLGLGAVFALGTAALLVYPIIHFVGKLESAARHWRSGDLHFQITPSRYWSREFHQLAEAQNEMARRLDHLYRREREIAVTLQKMLVSPLPASWRSFRFKDFYQAGSPVSDVGGDFYALFSLPDGRLGLLFGDIGGKGLDAAVKIAALRYALEAYAREGRSGEALMARANEIICASDFQIVTLVYLVLNADTGEVELVNAGHEPPLYWKDEACVWMPLRHEDPALGVICSGAFESSRLILQPNDLLLLYTDGVASVGPRKGEWSTDDLLDLLSHQTSPTPADLVAKVSALRPPGTDDAALVALQYVGRGS